MRGWSCGDEETGSLGAGRYRIEVEVHAGDDQRLPGRDFVDPARFAGQGGGGHDDGIGRAGRLDLRTSKTVVGCDQRCS